MMSGEIPLHAANLSTPYRPVAAYYEGADSVEYIRQDVPALYTRIDEFLTLIYDLRRRDLLIGFRLKGFKHFYLSHLRSVGDFVSLVGAMEQALSVVGDNVFDEQERRRAYAQAREIALADGVALRDLPKVATAN